MDRDCGRLGITHHQIARQFTIDLNQMQLSTAACKQPGQGTATRADLDHRFSLVDRYAVDDTLDDGRIMQEVLTEALARPEQGGSW